MEERSTCKNCLKDIIFGLYNQPAWYHLNGSRACGTKAVGADVWPEAEPIRNPRIAEAAAKFVEGYDEALRRLA